MEQTPENRGSFIRALLNDKFGRHLATTSYNSDASKPDTVSLPAGASRVVVRISNPQALANHETRTENEVATMVLMRDALASCSSQLIPEVYGWSSSSPVANSGFGYILQEQKHGVSLDSALGLGRTSAPKSSFEELPEDKKRGLLGQIAEIFKLIQSYKLPSTVKGYGGLRFDDACNIVIGPTTIPCGGPFVTFPDMYAQMLPYRLAEAHRSDAIVRGWRDKTTPPGAVNGNLRERLDRLAGGEDGIAKIVENFSDQRPTIQTSWWSP
ncbi:hypothetical protein SCUP515_07420 [Seiridium cupressi]